MTLSDVAIRRPVFTTMMSVMLVVLGTIGLTKLGTDFFPDVSLPVVLVTTVYKGAGPQEIEQQICKPMEDAIAGLAGIDMIHSYSRENVGLVVVRFTLDTNLDRDVQEVRDKVALVRMLLPKEAEVPTVSRVDLSTTPILTYAASAQMSSQQLRRTLVDQLTPELAQLQGVGEVRITGGDVREIQVDVSLDQALAAGLAPGQVAEKVGSENLDLPAGRLELGPTELTVRSLGQFRSVDDIRSMPVTKGPSGTQVRLDEIAKVTDGVQEQRTLARLNGRESIIVDVVKQPGSNTVAVADAVKAKLKTLEPQIGHGFKASLLVDQSAIIRESTNDVWVALIFGGLMAIAIILLFLLDLRGTLISSLALPTSVVGTFFVMNAFGFTLNQMTLLALSLAIGLLIDDAVVVREAITHRLDQGEDAHSAASKGTQDVFLAVLATTFSLVAVFVPVAFMPGIVGQFFKQFGITITAAVLISLFISFTLDPMLSARFVKARGAHGERKLNRVAQVLKGFFDGMEHRYHALLRWVLHHKLATSGITVVVVVLSVLGGSKLGLEFLPVQDQGQFMVDLTLGDGASLAETTARTSTAEQTLLKIPEVTEVFSIVGLNGDVNKTRLRVICKEKSKRDKGLQELKSEARTQLEAALQSTQIALNDPPIIEGTGDFFPLMIRVTGPDLDKVKEQTERLATMLRDIPGTTDVRVDANPPKPELQVTIDRAKASDVGLTAAAMAMQLRLAMSGTEVGKLREGDQETPILVRLSEADRQNPDSIGRLLVFTKDGARPVKDIATLSMHDGPSVIEHHSRERQVAVYANLARGAALGTVANEFRQRLAAAPVPAGFNVIYDGQVQTFDEQNRAFMLAFGLAFVFIYMVLASQFESFKHPFTIMVSVPLALIGAVLALVGTHNNLSLGGMIGIILLMGLVTKNAILLVDGALQNLRAGDDLDTALLKAGPRRLRPILMTSAAMAIGMLPTALGRGLGSEFRGPMAIAVIGGVVSSTLLTLLVVPVVFSFFEKLTPKRFKRQVDAPAEVEETEEKPSIH
ncbi:MAG: efflux RND transporter permease subunit [Myxococcaceae bacterium]